MLVLVQHRGSACFWTRMPSMLPCSHCYLQIREMVCKVWGSGAQWVTLCLWLLQTLRFQQQTNFCLESCTYICKVKEGSPAYLSGLQSGNFQFCCCSFHFADVEIKPEWGRGSISVNQGAPSSFQARRECRFVGVSSTPFLIEETFAFWSCFCNCS